jgi:HEAT repeat protein
MNILDGLLSTSKTIDRAKASKALITVIEERSEFILEERREFILEEGHEFSLGLPIDEDSRFLEMRATAIRLLGDLGADAKEAAPLLQRLKLDEEIKIRDAAALALDKIGGH